MARLLLLTLSLLLLLPSSGWAAEEPPNQITGLTVRPIIEPDTRLRTSCEQRMAAAMRAMDKYITYGLALPPIDTLADRAKAIEQWNAVKKQCWSQP